MKLRVEMSCTEFDMAIELREALTITQACKVDGCQVKVFHSVNREPDKGHSWVNVSTGCDINDKIEIYKLQRKISALETTNPAENDGTT